ncbi:MAG: thiamine biosynthesis protein ThiH [bacterium ADurb.Bin478]|nr:MAG: thiamine biosynthesis protein ThiH [bacterium ADurb.Bin478]
MDLAKPGLIKEHCDPNALSTFLEYLIDYASPKTKEAGLLLIDQALSQMEETPKKRSRAMLEQVRAGRRDVFC